MALSFSTASAVGQVSWSGLWLSDFQLCTNHLSWFYIRGSGTCLRVTKGSKTLVSFQARSPFRIRFGK